MPNSPDQKIHVVMSGEDRSIAAAVMRATLGAAEIPYAAVIRARNALYDRGIFKSHRLARPVISVGNITTGGTGKTPVVRWIAESLRDLHPAILLRGYKSTGDVSDEQLLLQQQLPDIPVIARPDRRRGAAVALAQRSNTGLFILDDGMQHRSVARNFELVLIDATNPFGFDHVLPRGLLREPLGGLSRAHAFLITRADQVPDDRLQTLHTLLTHFNPKAPIYHCNHVLNSVRYGDQRLPIDSLGGKCLFLCCGIGNPAALQKQLSEMGLNVTGSRFFADHHAYTESDLSELTAHAATSQAELIITTEKDWVKMNLVNPSVAATICRLELSLTFWNRDAASLLAQIRLSTAPPSR